MATFTGSDASEYIYPGYVSTSVVSDPLYASPSDSVDTIYANGGSDYIEAAGGNDSIYTGAGNDTAYGGAGNDLFEDYTDASYGGSDTFYGGLGDDSMFGWTGSDSLYGDSGNDVLHGEGDGDTLNGGAGEDQMFGGTGSDTYYVDSVNDHVEDVSDSGYDQVYATVNFTLGAFVERLQLSGRSNQSGTGNDLGNEIYGNDYANVISGLAGNDYLSGGGGNDTLNGGEGDDQLDGGGGVDTMTGGAGNDRYELDSASEVISEAAAGGVDTVSLNFASSWTLAANFENLNLYDGNVNGTGNTSNNQITGTYGVNSLSGLGGNDVLYGYGGNDSLTGGTGSDTMHGGSGDDAYYVDAATDVVSEAYDDGWDSWDEGGADTVYATSSYTLGNYVETLALIGTTAANGTGNSGANNLYGNSLANTLRGLGGADTFRSGNGVDVVIGGTGADLFQFLTVTGSTPASRDVIRAGDGAVAFEGAGAALGDRFDLSLVDANTQTSGVQDFVFGTATGRGRLWAATSGSNTLIRGNTDSDTAAEFEITIEDGAVLASAYTSADFLV